MGRDVNTEAKKSRKRKRRIEQEAEDERGFDERHSNMDWVSAWSTARSPQDPNGNDHGGISKIILVAFFTLVGSCVQPNGKK